MNKLPYAEDIRYWKTSQSSPDTWLERISRLIEDLGGNVLSHAFGKDPGSGKSAYMFIFEIENDQFKIIQPILPTYSGKDELAAKRQAVTIMYHDIKAKCVNVLIKGARTVFFEYLMLPNGQVASQISSPDLIKHMPKYLAEVNPKQIESMEE